ncbi:hypothetical protein KIPB_008568 [Kipferlia bialata]|uniref:Uncharacterized protein n=1 Tax=Kipferlia bialata TaxID=797122 RepID=A0A9K3D075_9EUKA|nr:hypothetical protein KIPB_008568 [Kipferlia bialata]|eukprot:g8568.t1
MPRPTLSSAVLDTATSYLRTRLELLRESGVEVDINGTTAVEVELPVLVRSLKEHTSETDRAISYERIHALLSTALTRILEVVVPTACTNE